MPTYIDWNEKLLKYLTTGLPHGSRVYLSIDDEALQTVGESFGSTLPPGGKWVDDFVQAVKDKCVLQNQVHLNRIFAPGTSSIDEPPRYLGFLCIMALAAHRMQYDDENEIENTDYFARLNHILGLAVEGRPPELQHGAEEALWLDWAAWLRANGYLPSAQKTGVTYVSYSISQALLRNSDKDALWNYLTVHGNNYPSGLSRDDLMARLTHDARRAVQGITKHLRSLLKSDGEIGAQRYDDLAWTLTEVYEEWGLNGRQAVRTLTDHSLSPRSLLAGLYRREDPISGQRFYHIFPRQPRYVQLHNAVVQHEGEIERLTEERPGWFSPLWAVNESELNTGFSIDVQGGGTVGQMVLQPRDFWVLTPDIDDRESGIYASWEQRPELGESFVLLCKEELQDQIRHLKKEGLIDWAEEAHGFEEENGRWVEYYGIMVVSDAWKGVNIENHSLYQQLYPQQPIGVSLSGGLRDPRSSAWMEGCGPIVTVHSFDEEVFLEIINAKDNTLSKEIHTKREEANDLSLLMPGIYRLQITSGSTKPRSREIRIQAWDSLTEVPIDHKPPLTIHGQDVFGAWITQSKT